MARNTAAIDYGIGSVTGNTFAMYLFGSGILSLSQFILGLIQTHSISGAVDIALNWYIVKLTPFPFDEFLTARGIADFGFNIAVAVLVGTLVATYRYWHST